MIELRWLHDGLGSAPVLQFRQEEAIVSGTTGRLVNRWSEWREVPHAASRDEEKAP